MWKVLMTVLGAAAAAWAQARISIRPSMPASPQSSATVEAARPLLGYVSEGPNALNSVVGSSASPAWGEPVPLPGSTARAFLPPRQEYALLASDAGLSVARLTRSALYPGPLLANTIARPDRVVFSSLASAAALVSHSERRMQALTFGLGRASVLWSLGLPNPEDLLNFTVSDDGELVVATFANRQPLYSLKGSAWQPLATNCAPGVWTFLPGSHDLVLSDRLQNAIVLLPHAEGASTVARVLTPEGGHADLIAADKQGGRVLAARKGAFILWKIELGSGTAQRLFSPSAIDMLTPLRDGETFLISVQKPPQVLSLSGGGAEFRATAGVR